jgi:F-type H+-transporting ATPase subunit b
LLLIAISEGSGGLNPFDPSAGGGLLWTWIIFLVALPFMWKAVMGPMARALESRDELAHRKIAEAEKASRDAASALAQVEAKLGEAQAEASRLLSEARDRAGVREREILDAADREAGELIEGARRTIQSEKEKALSEIRDSVVELSLHAASRVLERNLGSEDDRRLVESAMQSALSSRAFPGVGP